VGKGEGSFCCALTWWERWEGENPRWRTTLVFSLLKHFSSENELSGTFSSIK